MADLLGRREEVEAKRWWVRWKGVGVSSLGRVVQSKVRLMWEIREGEGEGVVGGTGRRKRAVSGMVER